MSGGIGKIAISILFRDVFKSILFFPAWWYSSGLRNAFRFVIDRITDSASSINYVILLKSLFKPMFGQNDFWGKVISFFVRTFHLAFLSIFLAASLLFWLVILFLWPIFPAFILIELLFQFGILPKNFIF